MIPPWHYKQTIIVSVQERVTELLRSATGGSREALDELIPLVYRELRRLAGAQLKSERPGHTLQATALANEAYLKLVDQNRVEWQNRAHFFAVAARVMRRVLVDYARKKRAEKHGGGVGRVTLSEAIGVSDSSAEVDVVALDAALERLTALEPRYGEIVELRFFGGLTVEETAVLLKISKATVKRDWAAAKALLYQELR